MKLLIAIPAYNEEASIESVIRRTLEARNHIIAHSPVRQVEITIVSDGSRDRTVERARPFEGQVKLIAYPDNRGYGAAIKRAWSESDADLLGFLDADGTCDPNFFATLCTRIELDRGDVMLGCRMNPDSQMPLIRRVGNTIFAALLTAFATARVRDTASGMRVVRRSSLPKLYPLPDGLHFTPAMSARAMLADGLKIGEVDMPYHARAGESKLRVGKDGLRFLKVMLETAFLYRPARPLRVLGWLGLAAATGLMIFPTQYYLQNRSVVEWMIYRFVVSHLAGTGAVLLLAAAYLSEKIVAVTLSERRRPETRDPLGRLLRWPYFALVPVAMMTAGGLLVMPSFVDLIRTGSTYEHWSRFIAMSFLFSTAMILMVARALDYIVDLLAEQLAWLREH
ncbi:MAG: glycosyltransferase family 2 protein [Bryobacteraceae bacterium]